MGCHSFRPNQAPAPTSNSRRTLHQRVATQSLHHDSCTFKGRTFQHRTTSQCLKKKSSIRHLPIPPFCEPSFHDHPLHQRLGLPVPPFPDASPSFFWLTALSTACTTLPVPSYFRLPRRPPRNLCPVSRISWAWEARLNAQQLECAAKPAHGSPPTPDCQTSTSNMANTSILGASKSAFWGGAH